MLYGLAIAPCPGQVRVDSADRRPYPVLLRGQPISVSGPLLL
jgi:hypothetical protein